jgi:hypothetical protein
MAKKEEVKQEAPKEKEAPKATKAKEQVPFLNRHKPMSTVVDVVNGNTYIQDDNIFAQNGKFLRKA